MKTRAVLLTREGLVHRVLIQSDGTDGTGCGQRYQRGAPVRAVQVIVYHLDECQLPGCWEPNRWKKFVEDTS